MVEFYRKSKVKKDVPISEIFSDKYGGLETDVSIRGGRFSEKYALEFQVPDNPTYGAGKLMRLDLGLHTTELSLADNSTAIPQVVAYRIKDVSQSGAGREITEGAGNKKSDDILIYSSQLQNFSSVSEVFNGSTNSGADEITYQPIQRTLFRNEKPYTTPKMMKLYGTGYTNLKGNGGGNGAKDIDQSEYEIGTNYGSRPSDFGLNFNMHGVQQNINYSHSVGSPADGNWGDEGMTYTQTTDTITPSSPIIPLTKDDEVETRQAQGDTSPEATLFKASPIEGKPGDDLYIFDNTAGVYYGNRDVIDNETYGNEVTSANCIFEYVRGADEFIGENKKSEGESELFGVGAVRFSNKLQRTGGQSCQMYTFWKQQDDDPVFYARKTLTGPKDRQECLIAKKNIPLPTKFPARPNWDNQDENHFASTVEIDIYIESLERAYVHKSNIQRTYANGAESGLSYDPDGMNMITARRALAVCFSAEAPTSGQTFYDFVRHHGVRKYNIKAKSYYNFVGKGQEGKTNGNMWTVAPTNEAIGDDVGGTGIMGNSSEARNFAGVLIVMTPNGPAIIPNQGDSWAVGRGTGWLIDDVTRDVQVLEAGLFTTDDDPPYAVEESGLNDLIGKWVTLVFKCTPDGWTTYSRAYTEAAQNQHRERGIYKGSQHKISVNGQGSSHASHSILQIVDTGSGEIIEDTSIQGSDVPTDHYPINNHYIPTNSVAAGNGDYGGNSLQHWPKCLSIWMMNYKNDKDIGKMKDEYLDGPSSDTSSSVFIDSVRFNNFNFSVKNCSSKKYNPNAHPVNIGPSSIWAGPDYPQIDNDLLTGLKSQFETNAPSVLSFGFKNLTDITTSVVNETKASSNFTSSNRGVWLLFNGYQTANLGANDEIPDCNIRFGWSGGYNGEIHGGNPSGGDVHINETPDDGVSINDWFISHIKQTDLHNKDRIYDGTYLTFRGGYGKDQTRKITTSNYWGNVDVAERKHWVSLQPILRNPGSSVSNQHKSYVAIHPHVFGNQFRNESIGAHRTPGQGEDSRSSYAKAMFTSRGHETYNGDLSSNDYWVSAGWRYNDVVVTGDGTQKNTAIVDTAFIHKAFHGYGTAQGGSNSGTSSPYITLQSDMDNTAYAYNGCIIIIEGGTGIGQIREIVGYTTARKATVNKAWDIVPDSTSKYRLRIAPYVGGHSNRGGEISGEDMLWGGVSAGTHNKWVRKYANGQTVGSVSGSPDGDDTDLQGQEDNDSRFESKWFDTGLCEQTGGAISDDTAITLKPYMYQAATGYRRLQNTSDDFVPIRLHDTISIGSTGQKGEIELPVTEVTSASLTGINASLVIESSTAITAATAATTDRPVYNKLNSSINNFNRKGFAHFMIDNESPDCKPFKRENLACSARVTEINNPNNTQIILTLDNANILSSDDDEEYIVYLYGQMATMNDNNEIATSSAKGDSYEGNPYCATGLKIVGRDKAANTVTFLWDGKANNGDLICNYENLPALMVSPYRYWMYVVIDCTDETGQKALNSRSYRSVCWMESNANNMAGYLATGEALGGTHDHAMVAGTVAARQNTGSTWNEFKFNNDTVAGVDGAYINDWKLTRMEKGSSLDCTTDYGYGTFNAEDNSGGYCGKHIFYKNPGENQTENIMKLPYIVEKGGIEPEKNVSLLLSFDDESLPHTLKVKARNPANDAYDPTIYSVYWDDRPAHPTLSVKPDEKDAFVPNFKWDASDEDLWYGLLHIDNTNIPSQYHNMIAHIPLNEDTATTYGGIYFENVAGTKTAAAGGTFTNDKEGLGGWAKDFNGTSNYLQFADDINFAAKPASEMTIVIHAIPDAAQSDKGYLLSKRTNSNTGTHTDYEVYIDTDEKINAKITPDNGSTLELKSNTILPRNGETPVSIIVTFDSNLKGGNMKLFVDGKLEDQTGLTDATGTSSNLKTGEPVNQSTGHFYIGCNASGITREDFYDGKIEEIVIYDKCLYPVNPKDGQFKLIKPLREVENGSPISYQGRLFVKDYHNIRGNRTIDIASSSPVSFAKAGFRLS